MATKAARLAHSLCPETCPAVDKAFSECDWGLSELCEESYTTAAQEVLSILQAKVKTLGTEKLRAALEDLAEQFLEMESERDSLLREVSKLQDKIEDLSEEVKSLERDLDKAIA